MLSNLVGCDLWDDPLVMKHLAKMAHFEMIHLSKMAILRSYVGLPRVIIQDLSRRNLLSC